MTKGDLTAQFDADLRQSGLAVSAVDRERLHALWMENYDRRARLRAEIFTFDDLPFETLRHGEPIAKPPRSARRSQASLSGDPCDLSLAEQARLLSAKKLSSLELTEACLARIERGNPVLRSFVTVDADGARQAAKRADRQRARGSARGALHGIPVAVKDMIAVAGFPMTAGSRLLAGNVATRDAWVVSLLRAAGAVLVGTNSLLEFGAGPYVEDGPFATGRNPWDFARIPGGSSSGSAIAVAAGFCSASLGTDTAGSVRMPASYTGVVGTKPTRGHISLNGVVPFCWSLDTVGTLTRTVEDAALVMNVVANPEMGRRLPGGKSAFAARLDASVRGLRLGVLRRAYVDAPDVREDVRAAFEAALGVFRAQGVRILDADIPALSCNDAIYTTMLSEAYSLHYATLRSDPEKYTDSFRLQLYAGGLVTADDVERARRLQVRLTRAALEALGGCDALIFPGQAAPPPLLGAPARPALTQPRSRFTRPWNIAGLPVLAMPCGFSSEGLPLSVHLAGRPFDEATLFQLGGCYQRDTDWHRRRPAWNRRA
ncbi:MAG: amidase [Alphaproteobacteria bacterium]|nr:amidase [Alphaproteobacteria bacterium]